MNRFLIICISAFSLIFSAGCSQGKAPEHAVPKIATTIFPLHDIAKNIVGERLEVVEILPPGASPHTYAPAPRQVMQMEGVAVVFSIGHGLDDWVDTLIDTLPGAKRIVVDKGIHLEESATTDEPENRSEHGGSEEHSGGGVNPHYWLSVENGEIIAGNIAEEIIRLDPTNKGYYSANLDRYRSRLDAVRNEIAERIRKLPNKQMITFHDAWRYYADEFGLQIVGTFEPFPGKQPSPRYLAELQEEARRYNVTALFSEPQLSNEAIASLVGDMGLKLYILDPLGGIEGRNSYIELLRYNTDVIVKALSNE